MIENFINEERKRILKAQELKYKKKECQKQNNKKVLEKSVIEPTLKENLPTLEAKKNMNQKQIDDDFDLAFDLFL